MPRHKALRAEAAEPEEVKESPRPKPPPTALPPRMERGNRSSHEPNFKQGTDLASISLASMASRMASPGRDMGSEEATEQQHSSSHSSSSANGGEGSSGHGGRSRDGSVDGDGRFRIAAGGVRAAI